MEKYKRVFEEVNIYIDNVNINSMDIDDFIEDEIYDDYIEPVEDEYIDDIYEEPTENIYEDDYEEDEYYDEMNNFYYESHQRYKPLFEQSLRCPNCNADDCQPTESGNNARCNKCGHVASIEQFQDAAQYREQWKTKYETDKNGRKKPVRYNTEDEDEEKEQEACEKPKKKKKK